MVIRVNHFRFTELSASNWILLTASNCTLAIARFRQRVSNQSRFKLFV